MKLQDIFEYGSILGLSENKRLDEIGSPAEIEKAEKSEYYPLSYNQKRLLILNQLNPYGVEYNMYGRMCINERINMDAARKAFSYLLDRHESLRTCFKKVDGNYMQRIEEIIGFEVGFSDISNEEEEQRARSLEEIYGGMSAHVFDLEQPPLMISQMVKLSEDKYELMYCMHHIISDGWSMELLRKEFAAAYNAYNNDREPKLQPLYIQYKDFAVWQNSQIENSSFMQKAKEYWAKKLEGNISALDLNMKNSVKQLVSRKGASYRIVVDDYTKNKLKEIASKHRASLFSLMVSAFYIYFAELTGQEDVAFGIAGSGRDHRGLEDVFGFFVNTVILRNKVDMEMNYLNFLNKISGSVLEALQYQNYPLELILDELKIKYPTISVFINMLNMFEYQGKRLKSKESYHSEAIQDVKFDIEFYLIEYDDGIEILCNYIKECFDSKVIEYMLDEYMNLLTMIAEDESKKLLEYFE